MYKTHTVASVDYLSNRPLTPAVHRDPPWMEVFPMFQVTAAPSHRDDVITTHHRGAPPPESFDLPPGGGLQGCVPGLFRAAFTLLSLSDSTPISCLNMTHLIISWLWGHKYSTFSYAVLDRKHFQKEDMRHER